MSEGRSRGMKGSWPELHNVIGPLCSERKEETVTKMDSPYEVGPYRREHLEGVVELMRYLWGDDLTMNASYFNWKYEQNPHSKAPTGIVALSEGELVGFRGFLPTLWRTPAGEQLSLLSPCDTCVHPNHRRRGLSVKMGAAAMEEYRSHYDFFLSLSCSRSSLPGYLRMGFHPLADRDYLMRTSIHGLFGSILPSRGGLRRAWLNRGKSAIEAAPVKAGEGEIVATKSPDPEGMARLAKDPDPRAITLLRDESFLAWRYRNPRGSYLFYHLYKGSRLSCYIAMRVARNRRGEIMDYVGEPMDLDSLTDWSLSEGHFEFLSVWRLSTAGYLDLSGFRGGRLARFLEARTTGGGPLPLLIRPVKVEPDERDWRVEGLDVRKIENWRIHAISSDAY